MIGFVLDRARQTAIVAVFVTTLAFLLVHLAPGDPFSASPDDPRELAVARAELRVRYGLDRPLYVQYPVMLGNMIRGRFGTSYMQARPVTEIIAATLPRTIILMAPALLIGILAGAALGTWQGTRAERLGDRAVSAVALATLSFPEFLIALILSTVFAVRLQWFPATGMTGAASSATSFAGVAGDVVWHAVLPVATLALVIACVVSRFQRAAVVSAMNEEFIRAVRAKGVPPRRLILNHVVRRTGGSLFTVIGLLLPALVGGAALVEFVFNWPGAGYMLLRAVTARDYPLVVALVLIGSIAVSIGSALADIGAALANPAARLEA